MRGGSAGTSVWRPERQEGACESLKGLVFSTIFSLFRKVIIGSFSDNLTFPNTEICQYEREFCHKWFILYSSFN
jgi:hypothetical protein